jgi:hypothetical protein
LGKIGREGKRRKCKNGEFFANLRKPQSQSRFSWSLPAAVASMPAPANNKDEACLTKGRTNMQAYETSATVLDQGRVEVAGVPFAAGTEVEVTINLKRVSADEFATAWRRVSSQLRGRPGLKDITDEDIREEIDRYRSGQ